jgi:hypothetical protein
LTIDYPSVGSFYSLDWRLPDQVITGKLERIIREARQIREGLLDYREKRLNDDKNPLSECIATQLVDINETLKKRYYSNAPRETFETTLITYDHRIAKLLIVDGRLNDGDLPKDAWRSFWLPFGLGLAGACFRQGAGPLIYSRPDRNASFPEHYIPLPGSVPYEFLLALPIDHPELNATMSNLEDTNRSRQLIGIFTIGSTSAASALMDFVEFPDQAHNLRLECQRHCNPISHLLLGTSHDTLTEDPLSVH